MTTVAQRSFSGGELAPACYAHVDQVKYATGLRTLRNSIVMRHGGTANRAGLGFVAETKDSSKVSRLIPFAFNASQTYVLELGEQYLRVHKSGAQLTNSTKTITGATQALPCVITSASHGFSNGDEVQISGILGMTELNGRNFKIAGVASNTFQLELLDGTPLTSGSFGAYVSGGMAERVYTLATSYAAADLAEIRLVQSADVITLVHPSYAPQNLSRSGDTAWAINAVTFAPAIAAPSAGLAGSPTERAITGASKSNPCVVSAGAHGFVIGDQVAIDGVVGMVELNGGTYVVSNYTIDTFEIHSTTGQNIDSSGFSDYTSGGLASFGGAQELDYVVTSIASVTFEESVASSAITISDTAVPTPGAPSLLSWTAVSGAGQYNVYRAINGIYGFIGVAASNSFSDPGLTPDLSNTPPMARNPFPGANDYPAAVGYYQQRLCFGGTNNNPEAVNGSRSGKFKNFTTSVPTQDDDALSFTLAGRQVNRVQHILDLGKLLVLTSGAEWAALGDASGALTPTGINAKPQTYNGSNSLAPIVAGANALYVQARGSIVRDLSFDFQVDGYRGNDLTIFAAHLFDGYSLVDWAYQQIPHSIIWVVRSDGALLGLTYIREQQIWGWHRHDTDGFFENVCVVPEGTEDAVYVVVRRSVNGKTVRYVERMQQRRIANIVDWIGMDSALSYDGRNTGGTTMALTGGSTWVSTETLTLTAGSSFFTAADIGSAIHMVGADGTLIRFTIYGYSSATVVTGKPHKTVPVGMHGVATTTWSKAVSSVGGLWHLEGKAVSVFADGFVVASPNNAHYTVRTVSGGTVALDKPYSVIHVGIPYISDLELLDIDTAQGQTIMDKSKIVSKVTAYLESSRGLWAGGAPPSDDTVDPLEGLEELKIRHSETYDDPVALQTGAVSINIQPQWNSNGRVFLRQVDPIPLSILAVAPAGLFPFGGQ